MSHRGALQDPLDRLRRAFDRHPLAREASVALLAMAGLSVLARLGRRPVTALTGLLPGFDSGIATVVAQGLVGAALMLVPLSVATVGYVRVRDIPVGRVLPGRGDRRTVALAALVPVVLAALVKAVAALTGTSVAALTQQYIAADAPLVPIASITAVGLLVSVPSAVIVGHVVVQSTLRRVTDGPVAVLLTTALVGLPMTWSPSALLSRGVVLFAAVVVPSVTVAVVAAELVERRWLRVYAVLPLALVTCVTVLSVIQEVEGAASGVYTLATVATVAVAAGAYERTDSLLVAGLAYAVFEVATEAIVFLFEAGVRP